MSFKGSKLIRKFKSQILLSPQDEDHGFNVKKLGNDAVNSNVESGDRHTEQTARLGVVSPRSETAKAARLPHVPASQKSP